MSENATPRATGGTSRGWGRRGLVAAAIVLAALLIGVQRLVSAWTDKTTVVLSMVALIFALGLLLDWIVGVIGPPTGRLLSSVAASVGRAVTADPEVVSWRERHPRLAGWLHRRFTRERASGLYLTATVVVAAYFLSFFVSLAQAVRADTGLARYDFAVSQLVWAFRTSGLTRVMWAATVLADANLMLVLAVVAGLLLVLWGRRPQAVLLLVTTGAGAAIESAIKNLVHRSRPPVMDALVRTPGSFSFPSGHALTSLVFFGLLAFVGVRFVKRPEAKLAVVGAAAFATLVVGVSRVYLGVHWMTDVLGGWALGLALLTVAIGCYSMWHRYRARGADGRASLSRRARWAVTVAVAAVTGFAVVAASQADPILARAVATRSVRALPAAFTQAGLPTIRQSEVASLPVFSEKLDGTYQEPIGLIFIGTRVELIRAFETAGWQIADQATITNLLHASVAAIENQPYPNAPVTPTFLSRRVQDLAFEKAAGTATIRRRHHNRWWLTDLTVAGRPVWVATASFDSRLELGSTLPLPTHHIDPNIDAERDYVVSSLTSAGLVAEVGRVRVAPPMRGTDAQGDPWFTAGMAAVLTWRSR